MDEFFIQEEVIIKTEPHPLDINNGNDDQISFIKGSNDLPDLNNAYSDNMEQFLLEGAYNRDLMVYLKCPDETSPDNATKKANKRDNSDARSLFDSYNNESDEGTEKHRKLSNKSPKNSKALKSKVRRQKFKKKESSPAYKLDSKMDGGSRQHMTFECSLCMYTTSTEEDLKSHMLDHIGGPDTETFIEESLVDGTYKCFFCNFYTRTKVMFSDHLKRVHGNSHVPSGKPGPKGADIYSDTDSEEDNKSEDDSDASDGSKPETSPKGRVVSCPHCNFHTKSYGQLSSHMTMHKGEKSTKGDKNYITSKKTKSKQDIPRPKIDLDRFKPTYDKDGQRAYFCTYCDYRALHRFRIVRHERIHTGEKPFACPYCPFKCNQEGTLKIHIRRHTGEKPYHCSTCSFKTISRSSLNTHEKIHNSGKHDVACSDCGLGFATTRALTKHQKLHYKNGSEEPSSPPTKRKRGPKKQTRAPSKSSNSASAGTQSYKCSLCNFRCSKFLELSEHTQMHRMGLDRDPDGQLQRQKYQCSVCGFKCSKKKELRAHIKVVHGIYKKQEAKGVTIKIGGYVLNVKDEPDYN